MELAATKVSFGPVPDSVFQFTPPAGAKIEEISLPSPQANDVRKQTGEAAEKPKLTTHGHGASAIAVLEEKTHSGASSSGALEGLPKVNINGTSASELRTELGTLLTFERSGVRYLLAGSVAPSSIEALARGL